MHTVFPSNCGKGQRALVERTQQELSKPWKAPNSYSELLGDPTAPLVRGSPAVHSGVTSSLSISRSRSRLPSVTPASQTARARPSRTEPPRPPVDDMNPFDNDHGKALTRAVQGDGYFSPKPLETADARTIFSLFPGSPGQFINLKEDLALNLTPEGHQSALRSAPSSAASSSFSAVRSLNFNTVSQRQAPAASSSLSISHPLSSAVASPASQPPLV